jgi:plasmid stabilization system protein ParE
MRTVRWSKSAVADLRTLLDQGLSKCGPQVIRDKQLTLLNVVDGFLLRSPRNGRSDPDASFYRYEVSKTPFVVIYEFDEHELRILFIVHKSSDFSTINPADVAW